MSNVIVTYDSGLGGLTVFRHLVRLLPAHDHLYVADDRLFPIGGLDETEVIAHCGGAIDNLIDVHNPVAVVIACNTASTLLLPYLREKHPLPFVGTVPAIKPAAKVTRSGTISVLATPGTVKRDYTRALVDKFAKDIAVNLVGSTNLAVLAESYLETGVISEEDVLDEIMPCFVEVPSKTDVIALACTHYPLLLPVLNHIAPWPVEWIDPGSAIARRCVEVVPKVEMVSGDRNYLKLSGQAFPNAAISMVQAFEKETIS